MTKTNKFSTLLLSLFIIMYLSIGIIAQTTEPNKKAEKKDGFVGIELVPTVKIAIDAPGVNSAKSSVSREPYLPFEPCAKETSAQIKELETAPNVEKQLFTLVKRIENGDEWLRACSVYRLGEFGEEATIALPIILKLLRDEENGGVWGHVEKALWKVPPQSDIPLRDRIKMTENLDVYIQLYGVYSIMYFEPVLPKNNASEEKIKTLIETAKSDDKTVAWLSVSGIKQLGTYGVDTSSAIPVLSNLIKEKKINPIYAVAAFAQMEENGLDAAPLLFDILYDPKKYENSVRSDSLYIASAIALARMGKILIPLLEKEVEKRPREVFEILIYMTGDEKLPILYKAIEHKDPEIRKEAILGFPIFTSLGAVIALPKLLKATKDKDEGVRELAINGIGRIGKNTNDKSSKLRSIIKQKVVPTLLQYVEDKELGCYATLNVSYFTDETEAIIPPLVKNLKRAKGTYCAEIGLFRLGEEGQKHLTVDQIERIKKREKDSTGIFDEMNKAKEIKPKKEEKKKNQKDERVLLEKET